MIGKLSADDMEKLLHTESVARIGCHADGRTYIVPVSYAYDGSSIVAQSAEGWKLWTMRENWDVCVEVDRIISHQCWQSVVAWGRFEELSGQDAAAAAELLNKKWETLSTEVPAHGGRKLAVYWRIHLTEKSGRFQAPGIPQRNPST